MPNKALAHYGTVGMHWYQRRYQNYDGSLTDEGRERYLKNSRKYAEKAYSTVIGKTDKSQQNRYHRWYRSEVNKKDDKSKETIKENILARKTEGYNYIGGLKKFYKLMKESDGSSIPDKYYNEDLLWQSWHDLYNEKIIEPAFKRYSNAIKLSKKDEEGFLKFSSDLKKMQAYGYSEKTDAFANSYNIDMAHYAYANYLMDKKKV